jgi:hypothetical protein
MLSANISSPERGFLSPVGTDVIRSLFPCSRESAREEINCIENGGESAVPQGMQAPAKLGR